MKQRLWLLLLSAFLLTGVSFCSAADKRTAHAGSETEIPAVFFVDSSLIHRYPTTWQIRTKKLCDTASAAFVQQFTVHLAIVKVIVIDMQRDTSITVNAAFRALVKNSYPVGDSIAVLIYSDTTISASETLGETEFGAKQLVIREIPTSANDDILAWTTQHAVILLHELGHCFGAIHVSDAYSVMNHTPSPIGSLLYDPINKEIITHALHGDFGFIDQTKYLEIVSTLLRTTAYYLADFPDFFQRYLPIIAPPIVPPALQRAVGYDPFLTAAKGVRLFYMSDSTQSIEMFDAAIKADSAMPALWYYRGLATSNIDTSNTFLTRAASAGYFQAQEMLNIRKKTH